MKNNKQLSPTHRLFTRPEKPAVGSHNSGSTIETSDQKLIIKPASDKLQYPKLSKTQSQTISILRKELKNIKSEVTKLIEEGFVKTPSPAQWLESSANMSSMSRSSKISTAIVPEFYTQSDSKNRKSEIERNSYVFSYDELLNLRQECENLKHLYRRKQQKEAEILQKQKQLWEEVKALRKCKQQLTKCIEILQASLKSTNQQMKFHIEESKKLQTLLQKSLEEKKQKQSDLGEILIQKNRLQQQVEYRKAQNNELIKIIQFKENEVQQLKINYSSQMRAMEIQYRRVYEQHSNRNRMEDNYERQRRARSVDPYQQYSMGSPEIERLQNQIEALKSQLQNRQKVMVMMLNDIKSMDKQLLATDQEHQDLLRCRKLIEDLNQKLLRIEIKRISIKYRYC